MRIMQLKCKFADDTNGTEVDVGYSMDKHRTTFFNITHEACLAACCITKFVNAILSLRMCGVCVCKANTLDRKKNTLLIHAFVVRFRRNSDLFFNKSKWVILGNTSLQLMPIIFIWFYLICIIFAWCLCACAAISAPTILYLLYSFGLFFLGKSKQYLNRTPKKNHIERLYSSYRWDLGLMQTQKKLNCTNKIDPTNK